MSKVLTIAAEIVGAAALAVGTFGVGTGLAAGWTLAASVSAVATTASLGAAFAAAGALEVAAAALQKQPKPAASPIAWKADPNAGIPYAMGECYLGGNIVYRMAYGDSNKYQTLVTVLSGGGPHQEISTLYVDNIARGWTQGGQINITDQGYAFARTQLGAQPEASNLLCQPIDPYQWTADCKLSGYAATIVTLKYDAKGDHTMTTTPQIGWYGKWAKVYDPRKDDTYPGGAGSHRWNDETTWEWNANPYLNALTWLIGRKHNGKPVLGVNVPDLKNVIVSQFVDGANVADANGWTCHGVVYSTDDKWDVLKKILRAGGGRVVKLGAQIGVMVSTPKVSLATVGLSDLAGDCSVQTTQGRKDRLNTIVPRYSGRLDTILYDSSTKSNVTSTTFDTLPGSPVVVAEYVAFDGKERSREVTYEMVNNLPQAVQLARYDIEDAREFGPITLKLKLHWMGYRPGDVITANLPELGLNGQDILIMSRTLDPRDGTVTLVCRSETVGKHAYALGQTGTPPETPSVTGPPLLPVPGASAWALIGGTIASANGTTAPVLQVIGSADSDVIDGVVIQYRTSQVASDTGTVAAGSWSNAQIFAPSVELINITGVLDETAYDVAVSYRKGTGTGDPLILGPATAGQTSVPYQTGVTGPKPPVDADSTTAVFVSAGRSPTQIIADLDAGAQAGLANAVGLEAEAAVRAAATYVADQPLSTYVQDFVKQQTDANSALASTLALLGAKSADGSAWELDLNSVQTGPGQTLAEKFSEIGVTNGLISAMVQTLGQAFLDANGNAKALYTISLSAIGPDGKKIVGGITDVVSGDGTNDFAIAASTFEIVSDDGSTIRVPFSITADGVVHMHSIEVDTIRAGSVTINGIAAGLTNLLSFAAPDVVIGSSETLIIETSPFLLGDDVAGNGMATITFVQDSLDVRDTFVRFRVYVDYGDGNGYVLKRDRTEGIQTAGGDTYWAKSVSFPQLISSTGQVRIKVTGTGVQVGGGGVTSGSVARNIEIDVLKIGR